MTASATIIPIRSSPGAGPASHGCGQCAHGDTGPVCRIEPGTARRQGPIELAGPPAQLARVLAALRCELQVTAQLGEQPGAQPGRHPAEPPAALPLEAVIQRLSLDPQQGEAELVLAVAPRCGGARLAETAFQILRRLLPETDIYVRHAPA